MIPCFLIFWGTIGVIFTLMSGILIHILGGPLEAKIIFMSFMALYFTVVGYILSKEEESGRWW